MKNDPETYLQHTLDSIKRIKQYTKNMDKPEFIENELVRDGVVRNIEIIGEAAKNLPKNFKEKHPEIPWKDIIGMRDRIVHFYFGLDFELVWSTVKTDIPELEKQISKLSANK